MISRARYGSQQEKCFACGRPITGTPKFAVTSDGQHIYVGPDCYKKIKMSGRHGYRPPTGGPELFLEATE